MISVVFILCFLPKISSFFIPRSRTVSNSIFGNVSPRQASAGAPAVLDNPTTKKETSKKSSESKNPSKGWAVRLYNDPMNKREFVARCLSEICGLNDGAAFQCMMTAHKTGRSVIGNYAFEMAEFYLKALMEQGLTVDMIPLDDE